MQHVAWNGLDFTVYVEWIKYLIVDKSIYLLYELIANFDIGIWCSYFKLKFKVLKIWW